MQRGRDGIEVQTRVTSQGGIVRYREKGLSLSAIARTLNEKRVPTAHGGKAWYPATVSRVLARAQG